VNDPPRKNVKCQITLNIELMPIKLSMSEADARKEPLLNPGAESYSQEAHDPPIRDIPPYTVWEHRRVLCCVPTAYVPAIEQHFIGHWEFSPTIPIVVLLAAISSYAVFGVCLYPRIELFEGLSILILLGLFLLLFICSYFRIIVSGPGYFPIYWQTGLGSPDPDDKWDMAGILSTPEQKSFIELHDAPPRSMFSQKARRYVLRPDHVCHWAASWIGKCNHKYFLLFTFYVMLYCGLFGVYTAKRAVQMYIQKDIGIVSIVLGLYAIAAIAFLIVTARYFVASLINSVRGITLWETWNRFEPRHFDRGSTALNLSDVLGQGPSWKWMCPVAPFPGKKGLELTGGYVEYCDIQRAESGTGAAA
jgi:hypothetical protein